MKKWYLKLKQEERQYLSQCREDIRKYSEKYGLTIETVREKYAKLMVTGLFTDEQDLKHQLEQSLESAKELSVKRKQSLNAGKFTIYNGLITQALLGKRDMESGDESVYFTDCEMYLKRMHWNDILVLSAIYNVISHNNDNMDACDIVTINIDSIYNEVMQSKGKKAPEIFFTRVRNTISKLRSISGCYTQEKHKHILHSSFFIDTNLDDSGYLMLSSGYEYLSICIRQMRLVGIDSGLMSISQSFEEQVLRTYIMWRIATNKNEHSKSTSNAIKISTMQSQTGIDLKDNVDLLKSICKSLKVRINAERIWWN